MALYKALRGAKSRISTDITPFHDGYLYLTTDDGGFYVDVDCDGVEQRVRLNSSRRDTDEHWSDLDPVFAKGEVVLVDTPDGNVFLAIGDGSTHYSELELRDIAGMLDDLLQAEDALAAL